MRRHWRTPLLLLIALSVSGCATHRMNKWGENSTLSPGWSNISRAAGDAFLNPNTYVPLLGAATVLTFGIDDNISDWAIDNTPIFGSNKKAETYSDIMLYSTTAAYYSTAMLNDSGTAEGDVGKISWNKAKAMNLGFGAFVLDFGATEVLKSVTDRERPDGKSRDSFPSLHTSGAAVQATLAARNLEYTNLSDAGRAWASAGLYTVVGSVGWARVEAGHHYPSDVLVGYALGSFIGNFVNNAFVDPYRNDQISASLGSESRSGWQINWERKFQ